MEEKSDPRSRKRRWPFILLLTLGPFLLLFAAAAEFTSHSRFCSVCHYMKPFYQSWKESSHGNIECSVCHYPPGMRSFFRVKLEGLNQVFRYWTKLYLKSKPWAEIPDESCLREGCHEKRLLEGPVRFEKVTFDHRIHFEDMRRGKKLRCTSCHSQIVQGEHITVTESSCFICHFKKSDHYPEISRCSHCHTPESLASERESRFDHSAVFENSWSCDKCHSQVTIGDGAVPRENCYKCHFERDRLELYDDTDLMHSTHIASHKIECQLCHLEIQHKIVKDIEAISDCRSCHTGFHLAQKILYSGEGGKGVAHPRPNVMLERGLSCKGCHIFHEEAGDRLVRSDTLTARGAACESCHGQGFSRLLRNWQVATEMKLKQVRGVYERAWREVAQAKGPEREKAAELVEAALFNLDIVEKGKSVHNMTYSQELLEAAFSNLVQALRLTDSSFEPEPFLASSSRVPTECSACHAGIEEIGSEFRGLRFSHKPHLELQKMDCAACHSNAPRHGQLISTKKSCASCHHPASQRDCGWCHTLQKDLYRGGTILDFQARRDIMAEAGVNCTDCHKTKENRISRSDASTCLQCHEESYGKLFAEWQESFRNLLATLRAELAQKRPSELQEEDEARLRQIERAARVLELDGSSGVHNNSIIEELLTKLIQDVKMLGAREAHEQAKMD